MSLCRLLALESQPKDSTDTPGEKLLSFHSGAKVIQAWKCLRMKSRKKTADPSDAKTESPNDII